MVVHGFCTVRALSVLGFVRVVQVLKGCEACCGVSYCLQGSRV